MDERHLRVEVTVPFGCEVRLSNGGEPLDVVVIDGYDDMLERYGSAYQIDRTIGSGKVHKVARGVYSDRLAVERYGDS